MIGLVSVPTHSEDKAGATVDLIGEMIECAAYFRMTSGCLAKQPEEKAKQLAERYEQQAVNMLGNAIQLGTPNGLTVDGAAAFLKSMATSMDEAMGGHCINIGVIFERYSAFCKKLGENPAARVDELLAGKRCSGSYRCK
jgi:hypothetical protein